jgi:phage shock protein E
MGLMKSILALAVIVASFFAGIYFTKVTTCGAACDKQLQTVSAQEFSKLLSDPSVQVIDVRTPAEYSEGHMEGAVNSDFRNTVQFTRYIDSLDKTKRYLVYCRSGVRAGEAMQLMEEKGFTHVTNLSGGILAWQAEGYSLTSQ